MNTQIAVLGLVQIFSALSCGLLILFLTYRIIRIYGRKRLGIDHYNLAYNVLTAAVLFAVGYIVSGVLQPIIDSFRIMANTDISSGDLVFQFLWRGGMYIAIAYIFSLIISFAGVFIYGAMTPMKEIQELKDNNVGVGVLLGVIIVVLAMFSKDGIMLVIESLVPYPDIPPR